jgi:hypothetical protein
VNLNYRATATDLGNEVSAQQVIEQKWNCRLHHLPHLFHVDWFAERGDNLVAWIEFKQRTCTSTQFETVFLNVDRKYKTLSALSVVAPSFFVVAWADGVMRYVNISDIDVSRVTVSGERNRWGEGRHDFENLIQIPIKDMRLL